MIQPTTHPNESKNLLIAQEVFSGGEGGIRTLDTLRYTRSPGARTRPDYATSPSVTGPFPCQRAGLYHSFRALNGVLPWEKLFRNFGRKPLNLDRR
jgi:hypothetical protein